jgi:dedicator of cytokinesis protein 3
MFLHFCATCQVFFFLSAINIFSSSRQIRKTTRDGTEEIWTEKTYYTTEEVFPTVLRRSEVINVEVVEISPLQNALQEVEEKTKELSALHLKYQALAKTTQDVSTNALAMSLNGAVDAPQNTGIASYRQVFFSPDYVARNPERAELVERLRVAIDEQVNGLLFTFHLCHLSNHCRSRLLIVASNCTDCYVRPNSYPSTKRS